MKSKDVFAYFGKVYPDKTPKLATAHALGLTSQAIYAWGETVPKRSEMLVELATKGKIKRSKSK
jgi:hypothetical protein